MVVEDSKRTRRRIIAYIVSQGGRISSGQNDNLVGWMFHQIKREDYTHERVTDLKGILKAMAEDGTIELEYSLKGRPMVVSIPSSATIDEIDEEDYDLFKSEGVLREAVWLLVSILSGRVQQFRQRAEEAEAAFEELTTESGLMQENATLRARVAELKSVEQVSDCTHEDEFARLREQHATELERMRGEHQDLLRLKQEEVVAIRKEYQKRLQRKGNDYASLKREYDELEEVLRLLPDALAEAFVQERTGRIFADKAKAVIAQSV